MGPTMSEKQAVTKQLAFEYKRAAKKNKGRILGSLVQLSQYNRWRGARRARSAESDSPSDRPHGSTLPSVLAVHVGSTIMPSHHERQGTRHGVAKRETAWFEYRASAYPGSF
jgi:hypothetical protein